MNQITLVIPAKNEPNALPMVLNEIKKKKFNFKTIVVLQKSDKSTIKSAKMFNCKIVFQSKKGYGNAIIEGLKKSKSKFSCIFYADGSTDPKFIKPMLNTLIKKNLDFVFGSRYEKNAYTYDDNFITSIGNFFFTFIGNLFMNFQITDILFTYIIGKTDSFKKLKLKSNDYTLCLEIPFKAKEKKLTYKTYPCIERKRFADKKKVKAFSDGFKILFFFVKNYLYFINRKKSVFNK